MKRRTTAKLNGLTVTDITYGEPRNNLPKFVLDAAAERG